VAEREWQFITMDLLISPYRNSNCSNVRKFSWQQKKDLNATERMHAHFCMILRRIVGG
jgi:hypothetical protein